MNLDGYISPGDQSLPSPLKFSDFKFNPLNGIGDFGFPPLAGDIANNGTMIVTRLGNSGVFNGAFTHQLSLRGFSPPAANPATITFNHSGLNIAALFDLLVTVPVNGTNYTRDFGNVNFSGLIQPNGFFNLAGNGVISFGNFSTDSFPLNFRSSGTAIVPNGVTPNLNFGNLDVPLTNFGLNRDSVPYTLRNATFSKKTDYHLYNVPGPGVQSLRHLRTEFDQIAVNLQFDFASGALNGRLTGRWNWYVENFGVPAGWLPDGGFDVDWNIFSDGLFTVNNDSTIGDHFRAPFWLNGFFDWLPAPGWLLPGSFIGGESSKVSFDYSLWPPP